jgi:hypothetical protein
MSLFSETKSERTPSLQDENGSTHHQAERLVAARCYYPDERSPTGNSALERDPSDLEAGTAGLASKASIGRPTTASES